MAVWNEADHPRDDDGKFTYKNGGGSNQNDKNTQEKNMTSPYFFELGIQKTYNPNNEIRPEVLGDFTQEPDVYTKDLINEIKNTEITIPNIGKVKTKDFIPNIENYIEDTRTKNDKRADVIFPSMKKQNPLITDIKLLATMFPYFQQRFAQELEIRKKVRLNNRQIINSKEWITLTKEYFSQAKNNLADYTTAAHRAKDTNKFLLYMQEDPQKQEVLKQMLNDFINGGELSMYFASSPRWGKIPDAAGLLRIQGKDSNMDINYTKKAIKYNNSDELPSLYKNIIKEKIKQQNLSKNTKGLFFDSDSAPAKRIARSFEIINLIKDRKEKIKTFLDYNNNESLPLYENKKSIEYKQKEDKNKYYAYHYADVHNLKYDAFGNISGDFIDTTDFNKGEKEPILVQKARELQDEGIIEPKFVIIHFVIPRKTVEKEIINGK